MLCFYRTCLHFSLPALLPALAIRSPPDVLKCRSLKRACVKDGCYLLDFSWSVFCNFKRRDGGIPHAAMLCNHFQILTNFAFLDNITCSYWCTIRCISFANLSVFIGLLSVIILFNNVVSAFARRDISDS